MKKAIRKYEPLGQGISKVSMDAFEILVPEHPFWSRFAQGWEPDTERIYRKTIKEGSVVLDIGAWIGPTLVFALYCGATKVIALEPNPNSFSRLERLIALNPDIADRVTLIDRALHPTPGKLKMGLPENESDTSTFGIGGEGVEAETISFNSLMRKYAPGNVDLVKIDIEGAEALLAAELRQLSRRTGQVVHLSVHVPLFPETADKELFANSFSGYDIFDDRGERLSQSVLQQRVLTIESHPEWGTQHGNFFELLLIARNGDGGLDEKE
jgi:FkbM family methyltransferase